MGSALRPLFKGARVFGPARTVRVEPGRNTAIHRAVAISQPGEVLVVAAGGDLEHGYFGDILALACAERGVAGLVIDGSVRDSEAIQTMGFPVFCSGVNPAGTTKDGTGDVNVTVQCGHARVRPNDIVSGDGDGVVVIPREIIGNLEREAQAVNEREKAIRRQILSKRSTCEIFGIATPGTGPSWQGERHE